MADNYLQSLISAGADLMSNLYSVEFNIPESLIPGINNNELKSNLSVRVKDFTGPSFTMGTHSVSFGTMSLDIPSPSMDGSKSLSLRFRLDENFQVYKALKALQLKTSNLTEAYTMVPGETGYEAEKNNTFTINVYALNQASVPTTTYTNPQQVENGVLENNVPGKTLLYTLEYCWVKRISGINLTYDNAEPVEITADIAYYMVSKDPMKALQPVSGGN